MLIKQQNNYSIIGINISTKYWDYNTKNLNSWLIKLNKIVYNDKILFALGEAY